MPFSLISERYVSRFGRNYIQVGQYVDYNIRFIALSDNVDTADTTRKAQRSSDTGKTTTAEITVVSGNSIARAIISSSKT